MSTTETSVVVVIGADVVVVTCANARCRSAVFAWLDPAIIIVNKTVAARLVAAIVLVVLLRILLLPSSSKDA
jgi:hypothetical protein